MSSQGLSCTCDRCPEPRVFGEEQPNRLAPLTDNRTDRSASLLVKRTLDVVIAGIGVVAILPLCLIIAVAIKLQTVGPLFYLSKRVGYKGKIFNCYKFRTMNAESMQSQVAHVNERDGILFKIAADPRITEVGLFLRRYSLDELPQLWNVLKGDMSLVGPQPSIRP
jgi:lipopolysaccharide/colanic/teichoic acid biosynthesis glycosyltransferase